MSATTTALTLHLGVSASRLVGPQGDAHDISVGVETYTHRARHGVPMNAAVMEEAIAEVEDAIMPLSRRWAGLSGLRLSGEAAADLMAALQQGGGRASLEAVEAVFNDLAAVAQGRPLGQTRVPATSAAWTALVIVREVMHHMAVPWVEASATQV